MVRTSDRSTQHRARSTAKTKVDAGTRSFINRALAFAQTSDVEGELGDSSVDLDLRKVEQEIANLKAQPTIDKIARSYEIVRKKIAANNKMRAETFSPYHQREIDDANAKLEAEAHALEDFLAIHLNQLQRDSDIAARIKPLEEQRRKLLSDAGERRANRVLQEQQRLQKLPFGEEKLQGQLGFVVRRPLTDFETAILAHPNDKAPVTGGYGDIARGKDLQPLLSPETGEPVQYVFKFQGMTRRYDIYGKHLNTSEAPLQEPDVDPVDALFMAEGLGRLAVKAVVAGGKIAAAQATKLGGKLIRKAVIPSTALIMGSETAVPLLTRSASRAMSETSIEYAGKSASEQAQSAVARGVEWEVGQAATGTATRNATTTLVREEGQVFAEASEEGIKYLSKDSAELAQAVRGSYGERLVDRSNALEQLIALGRDKTKQVLGRAAIASLRAVIHWLKKGQVHEKAFSKIELMEMVPSTSAGPVLTVRIHFVDDALGVLEMRPISNTPLNSVTPSASQRGINNTSDPQNRSTRRHSVASGVKDANDAGLIDPTERPHAVSSYGTSAERRKAKGLSGKTHQSAHIISKLVYELLGKAVGTSPQKAMSIDMEVAHHRIFDSVWIRNWTDAVKNGKEVTVGELKAWIYQGIDLLPGNAYNQRSKNDLHFIVDVALRSELKLKDYDAILPGTK